MKRGLQVPSGGSRLHGANDVKRWHVQWGKTRVRASTTQSIPSSRSTKPDLDKTCSPKSHGEERTPSFVHYMCIE
jgi:hypothetical protein